MSTFPKLKNHSTYRTHSSSRSPPKLKLPIAQQHQPPLTLIFICPLQPFPTPPTFSLTTTPHHSPHPLLVVCRQLVQRISQFPIRRATPPQIGHAMPSSCSNSSSEACCSSACSRSFSSI